MAIRYYFIFLFVIAGLKVFAQDSLPNSNSTDSLKNLVQDSLPKSNTADSLCPPRDLPQLLRQWLGKPPKPPKSSTLFLVPTIGSNPAMGFMFGFGGQYAFKLKDPVSLYSLINAGITFTTKNQLIIQIKNNIYTRNNKYFLSGDWRFLKYSQPTYGLSTKAPDSAEPRHQFALYGVETASDSLVQPMKFNFIRFYQTVNFKIKTAFYIGFGYHYDHYYSIVDEKLDTVAPVFITNHYSYSKRYEFNPEKYTLSGLSLNFVLDTRDNMVNAYKGYFANLNYRFYPEFLGNKKTGNYWEVEYRSFHSFSRKNPRHLLAFWLLGNFSPYGELPYLNLPALGYDQRGRSGRGYTQGRYRGPNMLYGEAEYRFPISPCGGILGGVLFLNATTADRPDGKVKLFDYVAPGYGMGLRIMIDKNSRTNLQVDFGFGKHSSGFYLGASETF